MKTGIGKLATAALMIGGLAATMPAPTVRAQQSAQSQKSTKDQSVKPVQSARQYVRAHAGGFDIMSTNVGTPPHIYGQFHVRRGSHKKTNKR